MYIKTYRVERSSAWNKTGTRLIVCDGVYERKTPKALVIHLERLDVVLWQDVGKETNFKETLIIYVIDSSESAKFSICQNLIDVRHFMIKTLTAYSIKCFKGSLLMRILI